MQGQASVRKDKDEGITRNIAEALELGDVALHEVEFEDLMLAEDVMDSLGRMAGQILQKYVPNPALIADNIGPIMEMMKERAFWVEETRQLIICALIGDDSHYIQIPSDKWQMRSHETH